VRKTEEEGRTANEPRVVIEKHNSKKERQKRDEPRTTGTSILHNLTDKSVG